MCFKDVCRLNKDLSFSCIPLSQFRIQRVYPQSEAPHVERDTQGIESILDKVVDRHSVLLQRLKYFMFFETHKFGSGLLSRSAEVTPAVQHLHFQKYNLWWSQNARRVKRSMRARMRWTEEQWINNVNHCAVFQWVKEQSTEPEVTSEMLENMTQAFLNGFLILTRINGILFLSFSLFPDTHTFSQHTA